MGGQGPDASYSRQTVFSTITQALIYVSGILLTPLLFKISGPGVYGEYALLLSLAGFLFGTSTMGVGFAARRYLPSATTNAQRIALFYPQFWGNLLIVVGVGALILGVGGLLSRFELAHSYQYLFLSSYLLAQVLYSQGADYLRSTHRVYAFNCVTVAQPYLYIAAVLCQFAILGRIDLTVLLWTQVASLLLISIYGLVRVTTEMPVSFVLPTFRQARSDLVLGGPLVLSYIMDVLLAFSDRYVIGLLIGFEGVGFYAVAYTLGSVPLFLAKALTVALPVRLARLIDGGNPEAAQRIVADTLRLYLFIAIPYVVGTIVLGPRIMALYASDAAAAEAIITLPVIALATVLYGIFLVFTAICIVELRSADIFRANAAAAVINLILNLVVMYFVRDIAVAAFTTLAAYALILQRLMSNTSSRWFAGLSISIIARTVAAALVMGIVMGLVTRFAPVHPNDIVTTLALVAIGVLVYLLAAIASGVVTRDDMGRLVRGFR